jgi:N-acetylglucosaminyldiphosphoundecaprenol N-acetyl-beta-D-mannosaminyltransferase
MLSLSSNGDAPRSYVIFGTKVTPMTLDELICFLERQVDDRRKCVLASLNLHALSVAQDDGVFRQLHMVQRTYVHIDGMPIVLLCRLAGLDVQRCHRVACLDFIWPLLRKANSRNWRVYYIGAPPTILLRGLRAVVAREAGIRIAGHDGYFDHRKKSEDNAFLLREIAEYQPDIILVGMGMGTQERWIAENLESLPDVPICTVGALIEYLAGAAAVAPRWMGSWGLEWAYRLCGNPRRFWHRYLVEPLRLTPALYRLYIKGQAQALDVQYHLDAGVEAVHV